jgi:dihydrofolate reductase
MPRLLRYNLAPTLNGTIATLPSHTTPWIVDDPTIDFAALHAEFDTIIMGRKTYEAFLAMPGGENPLAGRDRESVVVFTRDPRKREAWGGEVTVVGEGVVAFVRALKAERREGPEKDIWLMGGGELAGLLLRAGLLDVVEAAIMPVIVLNGVGMFGEGFSAGGGNGGEDGWKLVLEHVERKETGILMTRYRVVYE